MADGTHTTFCRICEALCGLNVTVEDNRVVAVHPDHEHVATRGVNVNLLAADGPDRIERVSGMAHLTGFDVEVKPAAGPQDPSSWSGLPQ